MIRTQNASRILKSMISSLCAMLKWHVNHVLIIFQSHNFKSHGEVELSRKVSFLAKKIPKNEARPHMKFFLLMNQKLWKLYINKQIKSHHK